MARSVCVQKIGSRPVEHEVPARTDLDPVAAGLERVEEERLLDRVLVWPGLDLDAVLETDVGCAQDVLAFVHGEREVVEPAVGSGLVTRVGQLVGLEVGRQPDAGLCAVVKDDRLGEPEAEVASRNSRLAPGSTPRKLR